MSLHDYRRSRVLEESDEPFVALVMAAMWRADTDNARWLRVAFPDVWEELRARYVAPRGLLPGEYDEEYERRPDGELAARTQGECAE